MIHEIIYLLIFPWIYFFGNPKEAPFHLKINDLNNSEKILMFFATIVSFVAVIGGLFGTGYFIYHFK